jgi:Histone methylation protein DOT1
MRAMFQQLRNEPEFMSHLQKRRLNQMNGVGAREEIIFVDLGSGDGRMVFRAAQEQMFTVCIGYEINPLLHAYAMTQQFIFNMIQRPSSTTRTQFFLRDLWNVSLHNVHVVAVVRVHKIFIRIFLSHVLCCKTFIHLTPLRTSMAWHPSCRNWVESSSGSCLMDRTYCPTFSQYLGGNLCTVALIIHIYIAHRTAGRTTKITLQLLQNEFKYCLMQFQSRQQYYRCCTSVALTCVSFSGTRFCGGIGKRHTPQGQFQQ